MSDCPPGPHCNYHGCPELPGFALKVHRRNEALLSLPDVFSCRGHIADMVDHFIEDLEDEDVVYGITISRF